MSHASEYQALITISDDLITDNVVGQLFTVIITYMLINFRIHSEDRLYETPAYFTSDWLNEYCADKDIDDYRFVYMGPRGSW